jgi:hypothetical protein
MHHATRFSRAKIISLLSLDFSTFVQEGAETSNPPISKIRKKYFLPAEICLYVSMFSIFKGAISKLRYGR